MNNNFLSFKFIGFSVEEYTLKYALITKTKNKITPQKQETVNLKCKTALQAFKKLIQNTPAAYTFTPDRAVLKSVDSKVRGKRHLAPILKNKLEAELLSEDILISYWRGPEAQICLALRNEELKKRQATLEKFDLEVEHIHPGCISFAAFVSQWAPKKGKQAWACFTQSGCYLIVLEQKIIIEALFIQHPDAPLFENDLNRSMFALEKKYELPNTSFYFLGTQEFREKALEYRKLKEHLQFTTPLKIPPELEVQYHQEVGAALALSLRSPYLPTLVTKKYTSSYLLKSYKRPLFTTLALSSLLFLSHGFLWNVKLRNQKEVNQHLYSHLIEKSQLAPHISGQKASATFEGEASIKKLLALVKKNHNQTPPFFLSPTTLSVTNFLCWLKELYNNVSKETQVERPFTLKTIQYKLLSTPTLKQKSKPYEVKVSLSFQASSPEIARKIQQRLLKEKQILSSKKKVSWTFQNNTYHASFYLKNFTSPILVEPCQTRINP